MGRRMKHTDIGDIPADWKLQTFEETFRVLSNNTLSRENLNNKGGAVRNIHYGDILTKFPEVLNCNEEDIPYLNDLSLITANTQLLQGGDVVIADTAEDDTVGKTIEVQNLGNGKLVAGLHTIPCRVKKGDFAPGWLGYYMNSYIYHDQIIPFITGIKVSSISKTAIAETIILVPPVEEQERIVETLSQLDSLIKQETSVSEKLNNVKSSCLSKIFLKDDEKKPEMRFPEFTDTWEQRKLGEVCQINGRIGFRGYTEKDIIPKEQGGVLAFTPTNIVNNQLALNVKNTYITRAKYDESPEIMVKNGNILFVKTGSTLGKSALVTGFNEDSTVNPQVVVIKTGVSNQKILSTILTTDKVQSQVASVKIGGAVPTMTETELKNIELSMPVNEDERIRIGTFFTELDSLITLHQRKCDKYKSIKAGLIRKLFP